MWSQAKFQQRFRFRHAGGGKAMVCLIAAHGVPRDVIPIPTRFLLQISGLTEGLLNLFYSTGFEAQPGQPLTGRHPTAGDPPLGRRAPADGALIHGRGAKREFPLK